MFEVFVPDFDGLILGGSDELEVSISMVCFHYRYLFCMCLPSYLHNCVLAQNWELAAETSQTYISMIGKYGGSWGESIYFWDYKIVPSPHFRQTDKFLLTDEQKGSYLAICGSLGYQFAGSHVVQIDGVGFIINSVWDDEIFVDTEMQ